MNSLELTKMLWEAVSIAALLPFLYATVLVKLVEIAEQMKIIRTVCFVPLIIASPG